LWILYNRLLLSKVLPPDLALPLSAHTQSSLPPVLPYPLLSLPPKPNSPPCQQLCTAYHTACVLNGFILALSLAGEKPFLLLPDLLLSATLYGLRTILCRASDFDVYSTVKAHMHTYIHPSYKPTIYTYTQKPPVICSTSHATADMQQAATQRSDDPVGVRKP